MLCLIAGYGWFDTNSQQMLIFVAILSREVGYMKDPNKRSDIKPDMLVNIILKKDQRSGALTEGIIQRILTSAPYHSRGIKVRLTDGQVGRVAEILEED